MTVEYFGPFIHIRFKANELNDGHTSVKLADGYTYERLIIHSLININELLPYQSVHTGDKITFPSVNCKSPSILYLFIQDISKDADIRFSIEKFGQIPDPHYFDKAFEPILVTGEDGKEYKVIPSDQFK
jgi:hypothetical protein